MEGTAAVVPLPAVRRPDVPVLRQEARAALTRAEWLAHEGRWQDCVDVLARVRVPATSAPDLALRLLHLEAWARMYLGDLDAADALCERARALVEAENFDDTDRAEALFRLGACRLKASRIGNAVALFSEALRLTQAGGARRDRVRARAFEWRARCYVTQRDWDAAQADAEHALELAEALKDVKLQALATMQCSVIAERRGKTRLALFFADEARRLSVECGDRQTEARLLNNLGGLSFLTGDAEPAVAYIKQAFALFLEIGNDADAAQAVSSLAQIHLRLGAPILAEEQARHALSILDGRDDYLEERGNALLVLGRALLGQDSGAAALTEFAAAERLFQRLGSKSLLAAAWTAEGDAYAELGDTEAAAALYRRAAETLQDFHF
ncbi:MAG TPA: tetratricopeptide repeat protein [Gaiellaceae bacterium]|nr:tetratricopeptide repeat protein [Gaiellaceae bacterium]